MENYVLIVNWNGWKDTIECLESMLRLCTVEYRVVVCDNGSEDGSLDRIRAWADGALPARSVNPALSWLTSPPLPKPIPHRSFTRAEAEGNAPMGDEPLVLIQTGDDLGYAGGNNVGLRFALHDPAARYFWIVNNDTVVDPEALSALVRYAKEHPFVGMCGSLQRSYYHPGEIQALGGFRYQRWTGRVMMQGRDANLLHIPPQPMDYVDGASMLVSRSFVEQIGLLDESYFIYFEELDWAERAKGRFTLGYAPDSVIYHKVGAAIGTNANRRRRSLTSDKYQSRNRVVFARRYCPWTLPTVLIAVLATSAHRLLTGNLRHAKAILGWAIKGLLFEWRPTGESKLETASTSIRDV